MTAMGESLPIHHEDYRRKRKQSTTALKYGSQIYPYASSHENSSSEGSSGQGMRKFGENFDVEPDESQKQERDDR